MNSLIRGRPIDAFAEPRSYFSRRDMLKSSALALLPLAIPSANYALRDQQPVTANGGTDPYPIPWLGKNGSHNQPAGPHLEPSHVDHFKGRVAPCSTFTGIGTFPIHRNSGLLPTRSGDRSTFHRFFGGVRSAEHVEG